MEKISTNKKAQQQQTLQKSGNATLDTSIKPFLKESGSTEKSNFPPFFSNGFASRVQSPSASS